MKDTLRDTSQLVEAQRQVPWLHELWSLLEGGRGEDSGYVLVDDQLLHHAPRGRAQPAGTRRIGDHPWHERAPGSGMYDNIDRAEIPLAYPQAVHPRFHSLLQVPATVIG